jgi:hypothetical protein
MTQLVPGNYFANVPGSVQIQARWLPKMQAAINALDPEAAALAALDLQLKQGEAVAKVVRGLRRTA